MLSSTFTNLQNKWYSRFGEGVLPPQTTKHVILKNIPTVTLILNTLTLGI